MERFDQEHERVLSLDQIAHAAEYRAIRLGCRFGCQRSQTSSSIRKFTQESW
jgi:hypothetical protein